MTLSVVGDVCILVVVTVCVVLLSERSRFVFSLGSLWRRFETGLTLSSQIKKNVWRRADEVLFRQLTGKEVTCVM